MDYDTRQIEIEVFENSMTKSLAQKELTEHARLLLKLLSEEIGNSIKWNMDIPTIRQIRANCLATLYEKWEGFNESKKPIRQYFEDLCKRTYRGECYKMKQKKI